jgi:hypothetical protein
MYVLYAQNDLMSSQKIVRGFVTDLAKRKSGRHLRPNRIKDLDGDIAINSLQKQCTVEKISRGISHRLDYLENFCFINHHSSFNQRYVCIMNPNTPKVKPFCVVFMQHLWLCKLLIYIGFLL